MKSYLNLFCALFFFTGVSVQLPAQPPSAVFASFTKSTPQKTLIPTNVERKFRRDAARLALRLKGETEDLRYESIEIAHAHIETFYFLLTTIYAESSVARSIESCGVHTFPDPSIDHCIIIFDKEVSWAAPLHDGISETDSETFNALLDEFDLIIEKHVQWDNNHDALTIRSREPLNMAALANEFYNIRGIVEIDLGIPEVSGNDIKVRRTDGGWEVYYILRFGSQINGQGSEHIWKFHYLDNGGVQFLQEEGDNVPEYMRCEMNNQPLITINRI